MHILPEKLGSFYNSMHIYMWFWNSFPSLLWSACTIHKHLAIKRLKFHLLLEGFVFIYLCFFILSSTSVQSLPLIIIFSLFHPFILHLLFLALPLSTTHVQCHFLLFINNILFFLFLSYQNLLPTPQSFPMYVPGNNCTKKAIVLWTSIQEGNSSALIPAQHAPSQIIRLICQL